MSFSLYLTISLNLVSIFVPATGTPNDRDIEYYSIDSLCKLMQAFITEMINVKVVPIVCSNH